MNRRAYHTYIPRKLDGKLVIVLSKLWQTKRPALNAELERWQSRVSQPLDVHRLDGDHDKILLTPELAELVNSYLKGRP